MKNIICRYKGYFDDVQGVWGDPGKRCYLCRCFDIFAGRLHSFGGFKAGGETIWDDKFGVWCWDIVISERNWNVGRTDGNKITKEDGWICMIISSKGRKENIRGNEEEYYGVLDIKHGIDSILSYLLSGKDN